MAECLSLFLLLKMEQLRFYRARAFSFAAQKPPTTVTHDDSKRLIIGLDRRLIAN